ncbi:endo-1,4-beta-xylanase [Georgenia halophila]|uniref:Beta-xylanase n=1 Tax=Georgenia halophila TaxID=620889 RepID=A0ABP8LGC8_9MICO
MRARSARLLLGAGLAAGMLAAAPAASAERPPGLAKQDTLAWLAPDDLEIGAAVAGGGHHQNQDYPPPFYEDEEYRELLATEFTSLTPENQLKWDFVHPAPDEYNFEAADDIVAFAEENGQDVRGHVLIWHSQNPAWLEEGDYTDAELRGILRDHITTVVGRYAGQIDQWEVANEIFDGSGNLRTEENIWLRELGPGIIADAFRWAHEAAPEAELFLNDYGAEGINAKSDAYYQLAQDLLADGVPIHGMGLQAHLGLMYGFDPSLQENLQRFDDLGLATAITELDVRMELPESGEPTPAQIAEQAEWFSSTLEACVAVEGCQSFTLWGASDLYSWVPHTFEGQGSATPWTEDLERKPAYCALQQTLAEATQPQRYAHHPAHEECRQLLG